MAAVVPSSSLVKQYPFSPDDYTRLSYSNDGSKLFVAGPNAFLRVYDTVDQRGEKEPALVEPLSADSEVLSVDCSPSGDVIVADNNGNISLLEASHPHNLKALVTRCNLSARDARFNRQGTKVAVASDELVIKIVDVRDTTNCQLLKGHTKAVRAVSWHPDGQMLTSSGSDGTLRVWDLSNSEPLCVKSMEGIVPAEESDSPAQCSAVWHPQGSYFVAATKAHEIAVIQRDTWSRIGTFATEGHETAICALAWSANGNYLASAGKDGYIIVWDSKTRTPVTRTRLEEDSNMVTELAWQPSSGANAIAAVTLNGNLVRWHAVVPADRAHPTDLPRPAAATRVRENSNAPSRRSARGGDEAEDDNSLFGGGDEDDWIIDDLGGGDDEERRPALNSRYEAPTRSYLPPAPIREKGQPAFQSGATAFKDKRRYLAFNEIGVVHAVERDSYQVITVDFHDQGARRGFHWEDYSSHSMASLGPNGVLTAGGEDIIAYRPYTTWTDGTGEWTLHLPKGEKAVACAMGPKLAIVATDAGYLRFLTATGMQTHLIDLGRDVVAVAIGTEFAIILHRANVYAVGDMSYTVVDIDSYEFVQSGTLPAFGETTIKWLGFCDDEMPAIFKSNGVLSVLDRCRRPWQARWTPILDTRLIPAPIESESKITYWPVWGTSSQLHYVILKGEEKQPSFPPPLTFAVDFQLPALGIDSAEGQTQERIMRSTIMTTHLRDSAAPEDEDIQELLVQAELGLDKELLQVMNLACKAGKLEQALEAAKLLSQPKSIAAAIQLAAFFKVSGLKERVERLQSRDGPAQPEKRESRWAGLYDDRTVTKPVVAASEKRVAVDLLAMPFDAERRARATSSRPLPPSMPATRPQNEDSGYSEEAEPQDYDEYNDADDMEQDQEMLPPSAVTTIAATTRNLFAKKAKVVPPPLSNSSAGNTPRLASSGAANLRKSDSFLTRVEEQQPKGPKQSTLFGVKPPPPPEPKKKGGKKRKSDEQAPAVGEGEEVAAKASRQTLADMFARTSSKTSALANEVVEEDEDEETQLVASPASIRPSQEVELAT